MAHTEDTHTKDEKQLSCDQLLLELGKLYPTTKTSHIPESLLLAIKSMNKRAVSSHSHSQQLHDFCTMKEREKKLSIVAQKVPNDILPKHFTAFLYDVKVRSHGPDDKIYNENADIRSHIPRGITLMSLQEIDKEKSLDVVLYANKKFTGGVGDEDHIQPQNNEIWQNYCLANIDKADTVVAMNKLNGEAAHLSGRFIDGQFYIITGSKNVHMLLRCKEDILKYTRERYKVAKTVATAVWEFLFQMKANHRQILFNLLHHTHGTLIFELLQPKNQHIVNLSHLKNPELNFICVTPTLLNDVETSLTALPPHYTLDLFASLGCKVASYEIIEKSTVDKYNENSRSLEDKEGHVLYYILKTNGYENTIGMAKVKTIWYVMLRALREKVVSYYSPGQKPKGRTLDDMIFATHQRFTSIQDWLKFNDEYLREWREISQIFIMWLDKEVNTNTIIVTNIKPQFPIIIKEFLLAKGIALPMIK